MGQALGESAARDELEREQGEQQQNLQPVTIRLSPELIEEIDRTLAIGHWGSRSELIRELLTAGLMFRSPEVAEEVEGVMDNFEDFLSPILPDLMAAVGNILKEIPGDRLWGLLRDVLIPVGRILSRVTGIPAPVIQEQILEGLCDVEAGGAIDGVGLQSEDLPIDDGGDEAA